MMDLGLGNLNMEVNDIKAFEWQADNNQEE
jgi:hypothetical protein